MPWLLLLLACGTQTVRFPPDLWQWERDSGVWQEEVNYSGPIQMNTITWGCDADNTGWSLEFVGGPKLGQALLLLYSEDPTFEEVHPAQFMADDDVLDHYAVGPLPDATPPESQVDGLNSSLDCEVDRYRTAAVIEIEDDAGRLIGCAWTGPAHASVNTLFDRTRYRRFGGCERIEP